MSNGYISFTCCRMISYSDIEEDCCSMILQTDTLIDNNPDSLRPEPNKRQKDT